MDPHFYDGRGESVDFPIYRHWGGDISSLHELGKMLIARSPISEELGRAGVREEFTLVKILLTL